MYKQLFLRNVSGATKDLYSHVLFPVVDLRGSSCLKLMRFFFSLFFVLGVVQFRKKKKKIYYRIYVQNKKRKCKEGNGGLSVCPPFFLGWKTKEANKRTNKHTHIQVLDKVHKMLCAQTQLCKVFALGGGDECRHVINEQLGGTVRGR